MFFAAPTGARRGQQIVVEGDARPGVAVALVLVTIDAVKELLVACKGIDESLA